MREQLFDLLKLVGTAVGVLAVGCLVTLVGLQFYTPAEKPPQRKTSTTFSTGPVKQSEWDGSVSQVKRYIERSANDPKSVEYVQWGKLKRTSAGYEVGVTFRAKNGFGALVLDTKIFTLDSSGEVLAVQ